MTPGTPDGTSTPEQTGRTGRKRDHTRDAQILDATLDVLAEVGYAGMTMDMVAARAKAGKATLYRRWPSKGELVVDAVARMKHTMAGVERLPDTGTLRGDLLALHRPQSVGEGERTLRIMAGLASMISIDDTFAEAADTAVVKPWADAHLAFMRRAVDRGEIPATADIETLSQVVPCMAAHRALVQRKPFDRAFLVTLVDGVIMPALLG
ncbi:TetR/AcrR family transcriptional regulator [Streptosporangium sp. DT93]|uniref:TetR/AcrR family transcriptional regulator n=1 Tax=Streptosporangium sp. DT93 TaxID=3393428 RepID=UPI003CE941E1